jgi:hypothetical protein
VIAVSVIGAPLTFVIVTVSVETFPTTTGEKVSTGGVIVSIGAADCPTPESGMANVPPSVVMRSVPTIAPSVVGRKATGMANDAPAATANGVSGVAAVSAKSPEVPRPTMVTAPAAVTCTVEKASSPTSVGAKAAPCARSAGAPVTPNPMTWPSRVPT